MMRGEHTDPYTWPEPPLLAAIRAQRDALLTGLAACIAYAERHDGRCPVGLLRDVLETEENR